MNNRNIVGITLALIAVALVCVLASSLGDAAARLVGKAVWYAPYVALVGAVRCLKTA